jgi:hypothetical protein
MGQAHLRQLHNLKLLDVMLFCNSVERVPNILYSLTKETTETACLKHSALVMNHDREMSCNTHVQTPSIPTNQIDEHCVRSVNRMEHTKSTLRGENTEFCSVK